jgi:hypothetical protein
MNSNRNFQRNTNKIVVLLEFVISELNKVEKEKLNFIPVPEKNGLLFSLLSLKRKVRLMRSPVCLSVCVSPLITSEPIGGFL